MHLKKGQLNYLIKLKINSKDLLTAAFWIFVRPLILNTYFLTKGNKQNLLHVFAVVKKLGVKKIIIEKINSYFGYKVTKSIKQITNIQLNIQ